MIMRDTVLCLVDASADREAIEESVVRMVDTVASYVPGYRLKQRVQFDEVDPTDPTHKLAGGRSDGDVMKVSVFLEVEGAAHYLPAYAGNLDIMTSAALRVGERLATQVSSGVPL
jgi:acetaldehyde dehydrogenase